MQREQFQSNLDSELRVWLIDQKLKNLSEAARLADQYVAVRTADRTIYKGHESSSKGYAIKPKSFGAPGHNNTRGAFKNQLRLAIMLSPTLSRIPQLLPLEPNSPSVKETGHLGVCFYCKKPGHILPACPSGVLSVSRRMSQCILFLPCPLKSLKVK